VQALTTVDGREPPKGKTDLREAKLGTNPWGN